MIRVYFEPDEKQCVDHTGWNITQGIEFQLAEMQTGEILSNSSNCLARRLAEPRGLWVQLYQCQKQYQTVRDKSGDPTWGIPTQITVRDDREITV